MAEEQLNNESKIKHSQSHALETSFDFDNEVKAPQEPEILEKISIVKKHFENKEFSEAEQLLSQMIESKKSEASLFYLRAEVYMKQNKFIQSLKDMNQAIKLEPVKQCAKSSEHHYQIKKTLMQMSNDI